MRPGLTGSLPLVIALGTLPLARTTNAQANITQDTTARPVVVSAPAKGVPSDAIVLFDGKSVNAWEPTKAGAPGWKAKDGAMHVVPAKGNSVRTKASFGDVQLHIEWRTPKEVEGSGQGRGNSGIYFMEKYELQVLDSYNNDTYVKGQAGAIYGKHPPLVNASRPPGEWQVYDIIFIAPRFSPAAPPRSSTCTTPPTSTTPTWRCSCARWRPCAPCRPSNARNAFSAAKSGATSTG